jgi:hypothetical protein
MADGIATKSRVRMWYLTRIQGRRIVYAVVRPRYVVAGLFIAYATTWIIATA